MFDGSTLINDKLRVDEVKRMSLSYVKDWSSTKFAKLIIVTTASKIHPKSNTSSPTHPPRSSNQTSPVSPARRSVQRAAAPSALSPRPPLRRLGRTRAPRARATCLPRGLGEALDGLEQPGHVVVLGDVAEDGEGLSQAGRRLARREGAGALGADGGEAVGLDLPAAVALQVL